MLLSTALVPLGAAIVLAAPVLPDFNAEAPGSLQCVSDYFNLLAEKVQNLRFMSAEPVCDLSKAVLPEAAAELPPPSAGLVLKHVAIGRGTQNYTCDTKNATAPPKAAGAVATLFNASCVAAAYPDLANMLPSVALQFNLTEEELSASILKTASPGGRATRLTPTNLAISGFHFFPNLTTPFFTLDTPGQELGEVACAKNSSIPAPADAPKGQQGEPAVPWLKLLTLEGGSTGRLQEVYRLETAGGSAPATCEGMPEKFTVQYAAQYWFFSAKE